MSKYSGFILVNRNTDLFTTTLFYSKLRPTFEPDYSTLEQTSFFQISFVPQNP